MNYYKKKVKNYKKKLFFGYRTPTLANGGDGRPRSPGNTDSVIVPTLLYLYQYYHVSSRRQELSVTHFPTRQLAHFCFDFEAYPRAKVFLHNKSKDIFDFFARAQRSERLTTFASLLNNFDSVIVLFSTYLNRYLMYYIIVLHTVITYYRKDPIFQVKIRIVYFYHIVSYSIIALKVPTICR